MFFPFEFLMLVALTIINVINNFKKLTEFVLKPFVTFVNLKFQSHITQNYYKPYVRAGINLGEEQ